MADHKHLAEVFADIKYSKDNSFIHVTQQRVLEEVYENAEHINMSKDFQKQLISALNLIAYKILIKDTLDPIEDPLEFIATHEHIDDYELKKILKPDQLITRSMVDWGDLYNLCPDEPMNDSSSEDSCVSDVDDDADVAHETEDVNIEDDEKDDEKDEKIDKETEDVSDESSVISKADDEVTDRNESVFNESYSDKFVFLPQNDRESNISDIWLKPRFPQFDVNDIWLEGMADGNHLVIRRSLPKIPKVQSDITVTTDISDMNDVDFLKLFPNKILKSRFEQMYAIVDDDFSNVFSHNVLGNLVIIDGYDMSDIVDNVVKYPHFYRLMRCVDGKMVNFYKYIELDGELYHTLDVWDDLPEAHGIPRTAQFIKEYVIRRYLLERDVKHIQHRYPLYGALDPFITLFCDMRTYSMLGYKDHLAMAKQCVKSRVNFYYTRNPIIKRLLGNE